MVVATNHKLGVGIGVAWDAWSAMTGASAADRREIALKYGSSRRYGVVEWLVRIGDED